MQMQKGIVPDWAVRCDEALVKLAKIYDREGGENQGHPRAVESIRAALTQGSLTIRTVDGDRIPRAD